MATDLVAQEQQRAVAVPYSELERMAMTIVKSRLFGVDNVEQAMTLMLLAQAEGVHPAIAMRDYHIVEGKPALKADAMLARFQSGGGKIEWEEYTDKRCAARFSHPNSPKPLLIEWTLEMAKKIMVYKKGGGMAPITDKNTWRSYPRQMLKARVISEGVRATNPGVAVGIYTVEETQDFAEPRKEKLITPNAGAGDDLTPQTQDKIKELADKVVEWLNSGAIGDAYAELDNAGLENDEKLYIWTFFDSKQRSALKKEGERVRKVHEADFTPVDATVPGKPVSSAQVKRLEAKIGELKLDREAIKAQCQEKFGKAHFKDLTMDEYNLLDTQLVADDSFVTERPS